MFARRKLWLLISWNTTVVVVVVVVLKGSHESKRVKGILLHSSLPIDS